MKSRCPWANAKNPLLVEYHDSEWGKPLHDDIRLFEMLILEGAQAGLSWEIILKKRKAYRVAFDDFDPVRVARYTDKKIEKILTNPGIVRNRLKVVSTIGNAKTFIQVQKEFGSFNKYIWSYVNSNPIVNTLPSDEPAIVSTPLSETISKDLKKRGFRFIGPTIIYAYMQAIGMVNDHVDTCWLAPINQACWYVYMIETAVGTLYTGITKDVNKRFSAHSKQGTQCAKYLRGKAPLKLVFQAHVGTKSNALKLELEIKKLSSTQKKTFIKGDRRIIDFKD
jgi:DNA-3-methyladenine glycosylase I